MGKDERKIVKVVVGVEANFNAETLGVGRGYAVKLFYSDGSSEIRYDEKLIGFGYSEEDKNWDLLPKKSIAKELNVDESIITFVNIHNPDWEE